MLLCGELRLGKACRTGGDLCRSLSGPRRGDGERLESECFETGLLRGELFLGEARLGGPFRGGLFLECALPFWTSSSLDGLFLDGLLLGELLFNGVLLNGDFLGGLRIGTFFLGGLFR